MTRTPPTPPRRAAIQIDDGPTAETEKPKEPLNLGGFVAKGPKIAPEAAAIRQISEQADFHSREATPDHPSANTPTTGRTRRRRRSNRVIQFNVKLAPDTIDQISDIADDQNWTYAELIEHAVAALDADLKK